MFILNLLGNTYHKIVVHQSEAGKVSGLPGDDLLKGSTANPSSFTHSPPAGKNSNVVTHKNAQYSGTITDFCLYNNLLKTPFKTLFSENLNHAV